MRVRYQWKVLGCLKHYSIKHEALIKKILEKKDDLLKVYNMPETIEMKG